MFGFRNIAKCLAATTTTSVLLHSSYSNSADDIRSQGFTVLSKLLTEEERLILLRHTRRDMDVNEQELNQLPPTASPTTGRNHCELTSTFHRKWCRSDDKTISDIKKIVLQVEEKTVEFAQTYFKQDRFRLTQLQLLDSEPNSAAQFWHVDNTTAGLTFVIALDDIRLENGPTELLLGTQHVHDSHNGDVAWVKSYIMYCNSIKQKEDSLIASGYVEKMEHKQAIMNQRDAFVFDSRIWHRGGANRSTISRPVLIVRYDLSNYSPPGMGIVSTALLRSFGLVIENNLASCVASNFEKRNTKNRKEK